MRRAAIVGLQATLLLGFTACGGGGGDGFAPYATYAGKCSVVEENHWLRSWTHDLYLWYSEVEDVNPATVASPADYFDLMKTMVRLPSGQDKDRFHFTYPTDLWQQLSQSGISVGYGASWKDDVASEVFVQFVEPGSPAQSVGIKRGDEVLRVDGVAVHDIASQHDVDTVFDGLYPAAANEMHTFVFRDRDGGADFTRTLTATDFAADPVPVTRVLDTAGGKVGYLLFNSHDRPAESQLIDAVNTFRSEHITDLVLDMRYNGGGYLFVASQLAWMIAGSAATNGKDFERIQFNDQHPFTDPVTGNLLQPYPFLDVTSGLGSLRAGQALPALNLSRLFVLTSGGTCSASESVINGLRGIGIAVHLVGADTCGKPYGFYPQDNCGTTYFSIQFQGVNEAGFGDYLEGFSATRGDIAQGARLPGCTVEDDLAHELGDADEAQLAAALTYRAASSCPAEPSSKPRLSMRRPLPEGLRAAWRPPAQPWRAVRLLNRPAR